MNERSVRRSSVDNVWRAREALLCTSPELLDALVALGHRYGPEGVAVVSDALAVAAILPQELLPEGKYPAEGC